MRLPTTAGDEEKSLGVKAPSRKVQRIFGADGPPMESSEPVRF